MKVSVTDSKSTLPIALTTAACLPRGLAPQGQQILADRQSQLGPIVAPSGDGVLRIQARTASPYDGIWVANCP